MAAGQNSWSYQAGPRNLITDVPGLRVGNAHDDQLRSGVTVLLPDKPATSAADIRGGGSGTRETDVLSPGGTIREIHALVLSGGSAFGLDAAGAVQNYLKHQGKGFQVGSAIVPIVPQAILFDLLNGGDKEWGQTSPYPQLAAEACQSADEGFALGTAGAGYGATTCSLKGGLGSASSVTEQGINVGALVAVNAAGDAIVGDSKHFWAGCFELGNEFGGHGPGTFHFDPSKPPGLKGSPRENTTLGIVATDVTLDKIQAQRLAIMAHAGMAKAIHPIHTPLDGDIVFAISTGKRALKGPVSDLAHLGTLAATTLARAIARGVYEAAPFATGKTFPPTYQQRFGS